MSKKAYDRGTEVIRRDIDRQVTKAEEMRAGRMFDKLVREGEILEAKYNALQAELESTKVELERARSAYHRRSAEVEVLKEEIRSLQDAKKSEHEHYMDTVRALIDSRKGHEKLTAVMRLALTPEQYHQYRQAAADVYPELFSK